MVNSVIIIGSGFAGLFSALGASQNPTRKIQIITTSFQEKPVARPIERHSLYRTRSRGDFQFSSDNCEIYRPPYGVALSELWGRGIEPPHKDDSAAKYMYEKYKQSYHAIAEYIPIANTGDELDECFLFPEHIKRKIALDKRAHRILACLRKNKTPLNQFITFGRSRIAVSRCNLCGECFKSCPLGSMYSSRDLLSEVRQKPNIEIVEGFRVDRYTSKEGSVNVTGQFINSEDVFNFSAEKLVIAAGVIDSVMLYMASSNTREIFVKQSDIVRVPFLSFFKLAKTGADASEACLSQLTVAFRKSEISKYPVIGHLFTVTRGLINTVFPNFHRAFQEFLWRALRNRLVVVSFFFSSESSGAVRVKYLNNKFYFTGESYRRSLSRYFRLLATFAKLVPFSGLLPIPYFKSIAKPGGSIHLGGGIPVDYFGESSQQRNVFFADASALETVPAGSYTFTIMAHAYFVGSNL
jgi:hypothetical protein